MTAMQSEMNQPSNDKKSWGEQVEEEENLQEQTNRWKEWDQKAVKESFFEAGMEEVEEWETVENMKKTSVSKTSSEMVKEIECLKCGNYYKFDLNW
jgi:hypothetical protein